MHEYAAWAARHPAAAAELNMVLGSLNPVTPEGGAGKSEAWSQQQDRFRIAKAGAYSWRNNVGATPAKCPVCKTPQQPTRYGLCNDSHQLNEKLKSSDLILAIPRLITPAMVGSTIAQFGSVEEKAPGWHYTGQGREVAQAAWLTLISSIGGFAAFSTGNVEL